MVTDVTTVAEARRVGKEKTAEGAAARLTVVEAAVTGLPEPSRRSTVAMAEQLPAATVCGAVVKASAVAPPATMVSTCEAGVSPVAEAVMVTEPAAVPRK